MRSVTRDCPKEAAETDERKSRKGQVKNGLRTGSILLARKKPSGVFRRYTGEQLESQTAPTKDSPEESSGDRWENSKASAARISIANEAC